MKIFVFSVSSDAQWATKYKKIGINLRFLDELSNLDKL